MIRKLTLMLVAFLSPALGLAQRGGDLGGGVILGVPIGGTAKYWLDGVTALDAGVGVESSDAVFWGDIVWHSWDMLPQPQKGKLGITFGAGPRIHAQDDTAFGIRVMGGLSYWLARQPVELFFEAGPVFRLTPRGGVDADGGVGVRFYFGGAKKA